MTINIPLVVYLAYGSTANFRFLGLTAKIYISKEREGYGVRSGARILEIDQVIRKLSGFSQVQSEREQTLVIREYGSTLYVGLARAANFRLTFLLTRLQETHYEDLAV